MQIGGMADISKMLADGGPYRNFPQGRSQTSGKLKGIAIGPVCRAEAGHRDRDNAGTGQLQCIKGPGRHQQRQGRIQSAGQADDGRLTMGMRQPLHKALNLQGQNFFAARRKVGRISRHERMRFDRALQIEPARR